MLCRIHSTGERFTGINTGTSAQWHASKVTFLVYNFAVRVPCSNCRYSSLFFVFNCHCFVEKKQLNQKQISTSARDFDYVVICVVVCCWLRLSSRADRCSKQLINCRQQCMHPPALLRGEGSAFGTELHRGLCRLDMGMGGYSNRIVR